MAYGLLFRSGTLGELADPPTRSAAVPNWKADDTIHLERKSLRVVGKENDDAVQRPELIC